MSESKWPDHESQVGFRSDIYRLYNYFGVTVEEIREYGRLSTIIRGFEVKQIYDDLMAGNSWKYSGTFETYEPYEWMGGCGPDRRSSLDFRLVIPSRKLAKNGKFYYMMIKTERRAGEDDTEYFIDFIEGKGMTHECGSAGYQTNVQRFGPCLHPIATTLILQENSAKWCNQREEPFYHGLRVAEVYRNKKGLPLQVFGSIPRELQEVYDNCTQGMYKGHIQSLHRESAILLKAAEIKYELGLLNEKQLDVIVPILEENFHTTLCSS